MSGFDKVASLRQLRYRQSGRQCISLLPNLEWGSGIVGCSENRSCVRPHGPPGGQPNPRNTRDTPISCTCSRSRNTQGIPCNRGGRPPRSACRGSHGQGTVSARPFSLDRGGGPQSHVAPGALPDIDHAQLLHEVHLFPALLAPRRD